MKETIKSTQVKTALTGLALLCTMYTANAQHDKYLGIIPAPVSVEKQTGYFKLDKTVVLVQGDQANAATADLLNAFIANKGGFALREVKQAGKAERAIVFTTKGAENLPAEGYKINVTPQQIEVIGKDAGLFYAVQSLIQMIPEKTGQEMNIPASRIEDFPRFKYRGMMLDVSRHAFSISFIKKYIDLIAQYKMNTFHWHLTDDQAWRIEIKKYPKLTEIGASRNGTIQGRLPGFTNDNTVYKYFYTQEEIKDIIAYAERKFITIIPEIEMPGHASAAIAAYPQLSAFPDRDTYIDPKTPWAGPRKGKQVQQTFGVFDDVYVPTDFTFNFLENVLSEVIALFPSKYIHIGGDESPKTYWKESAFCQQLIKEKGLKDEHELQSYFVQRIEKFVNSKGRSIIGWDEILEGGLAPNATVMSWRGLEGGIAAAQQHHDVIMTPSSDGLYLDYSQSASMDEPTGIGGFNPYSKTYNYDPIPAVLKPEERKYILGVQGNLWTEYISSPEKVEYMILPKLFALSETAWTPHENKDLQNFVEERLPYHLAKLDKTNTNYWVPTPIGQPEKSVQGESVLLNLKAPVLGSKIFYTVDGTRPTELGIPYKPGAKIIVPAGKELVLKTVVITPKGKSSVVTETKLNNTGK